MTKSPFIVEPRELAFVRIVFSCVGLAVVYGVLHDLVTAHVQVEYFLPPWHPKIISSESPVALAFLWGVIATWWMGAIFGSVVAAASVMGRYPPLAWGWVVKRVAALLLMSLLLAYGLLFTMLNFLVGRGSFDPKEQRLMCILVTHNFSYFFTAIAALVLSIWILFKRRRMMAS